MGNQVLSVVGKVNNEGVLTDWDDEALKETYYIECDAIEPGKQYKVTIEEIDQ